MQQNELNHYIELYQVKWMLSGYYGFYLVTMNLSSYNKLLAMWTSTVFQRRVTQPFSIF